MKDYGMITFVVWAELATLVLVSMIFSWPPSEGKTNIFWHRCWVSIALSNFYFRFHSLH